MTTTRNASDALEHEIGRRGEFSLRVHTGGIELRATEGDAVRVRDLDGHDLEERFEIERGPGRLAMRPRDRVILDLGPIKRGRGSGHLAVELPAEATVSIDTANADVRAAGLIGEQRYRTASGRVDLAGSAGPIGLDAVSGSIAIAAVGEIDLSGRTISGDLRLQGGHLRSVAFGTTSGDLELGAPLDGPGPFSIQTVSGDVDVVVGRPGLRIEAKTITGQVTTDQPALSERGAGRQRLVVGAGSAELTFKSISGDLRVASRAPGSGEAVSPVPPEPPAPPAAPNPPPVDSGAPVDTQADPRLAVLRDLESGVIDVETATRRLAAIEEAIDA